MPCLRVAAMMFPSERGMQEHCRKDQVLAQK
jgi:hypothetical protein